MGCGGNFAWANRQVLITRFARRAFEQFFGAAASAWACARLRRGATTSPSCETHKVDGRERDVLVHRKGATRAFPPGHRGRAGRLPRVGQPVHHPRRHGPRQLVLVGHRDGDERDLRLDLPRRRAACCRARRQFSGPRAGGSTRSCWPAAWSPALAAKQAWRKNSPRPTRMSTTLSIVSSKRGCRGKWRG